MNEDRSKHLELIQAIIGRMAGNAFLLKGWTVTVTAALFALAAKDANPMFIAVAIFPAISFWGLDAYYLRQERLYRKLYDDVRLSVEGASLKVEPFSLSTEACKDVPGWFRTLWSPTVIALHGVVVGTVVIVLVLLCSTR